jgi:Co/Zn/Cd efflux system component
MDCSSEEAMVRMKLEGIKGIHKLSFDLKDRKLLVWHEEGTPGIDEVLSSLNLGSQRKETVKAAEEASGLKEESLQRKVLIYALAINALFFVFEMTAGLFSRSMGLVADSLDMLADALVYGISLFAVGRAADFKKRTARIAGYTQLLLAGIGIMEVLRRFFTREGPPEFVTMMSVAFLALIANAITLIILQKARSKEAHIRASMIFTANDILINAGVIVAGALVYWLETAIPDLVIGGLVFLVVVRGAIRILALSR